MELVKVGDTVTVHYKGTLDDGSIFDTSYGRQPLTFTAGVGQMIAGFDKAVIGMKVGDKKTERIIADEAYGRRDEEMIRKVARQELPADIIPEIGMFLQMGDEYGNEFDVVITEVNDEFILLDANHELADKDLIFEIEVVKIGS